MTHDQPVLPKHLADHGDAVSTAIIDAVDDQPAELRASLYAAIKAGDYSIREPRVITVLFPTVENGTAIEVALIEQAPRPRPAFDA